MKLTITIDQPDALLEGLSDYAEDCASRLIAEKGRDPLGIDGLDEAAIEAAEWTARERAEKVLAAWWSEDGVCALEFDLDADPPTARVLRRDGKVEIGGRLFTSKEAEAVRQRAAAVQTTTQRLKGSSHDEESTTQDRPQIQSWGWYER